MCKNLLLRDRLLLVFYYLVDLLEVVKHTHKNNTNNYFAAF